MEVSIMHRRVMTGGQRIRSQMPVVVSSVALNVTAWVISLFVAGWSQ
jgi:hypothetical protein